MLIRAKIKPLPMITSLLALLFSLSIVYAANPCQDYANRNCDPLAQCYSEEPGVLQCKCPSGYVDVSPDATRLPGRKCKKVETNCDSYDGQCGPSYQCGECDPNADCIAKTGSYTCKCKIGWLDISQDPFRAPGRRCQQIPQNPPRAQCNVNDPMSCDVRKHEVCLFKDGKYQCGCPNGYGRLPDGKCLATNECADPQLNECSKDADCIDKPEGFECRCKWGFIDVSPIANTGSVCKRRNNECSNPHQYGVNCGEHAYCVDTDDGYTCKCYAGYTDASAQYYLLPGRKCIKAINECQDTRLNDCSENAICEDTKDGYICKCRPGFLDASPDVTRHPGRVCNPISESTDDEFPSNQQSYEQTCNQANCDRNAACTNTYYGEAKCQCRPGYIDASPDPVNNPGKVCRQQINECATKSHECDANAHCVDQANGYSCVCNQGYNDVSSQYGLLPGRKCSNSNNECSDRSLNSCDDNADCVDTPDGYTCQCFSGYIDVSSSANLPPGRVCTLQTSCPSQKTDLIFLIDGSGSIGSSVFKKDVLRFVKEFVELFDIGQDKTRVGLIQYSDQIKHEFDLDQYMDRPSVVRAVDLTAYLTGLTRTGAAIDHMVREGFSTNHGARPISNGISRVAIVITDGRSQDNVTTPALMARQQQISVFAIGVTDHVLASELETISGSPKKWFYVDRFKDLDMRLRSIIQKEACPPSAHPPTPCSCEINEIAVVENGRTVCKCPPGFERHPLTHVCGGKLCNPDLPSTCDYPEECRVTPCGNSRCACPVNYGRDPSAGTCVTPPPPQPPPRTDCSNGGVVCPEGSECKRDAFGKYICDCKSSLERHPVTGKCQVPGSCDPTAQTPCDVRKKECCMLHPSGQYFTCQCCNGLKRHPVTDVCLHDECTSGEADCSKNATCTDTDDSYICTCFQGFIDQSPDPIRYPGRVCNKRPGCDNSRCSQDSTCTETSNGPVCRCKPEFVDVSPNPMAEPGIKCVPKIDECARGLHNCSINANCRDLEIGYTCQCKQGFVDHSLNPALPGRKCDTTSKCKDPKLNSCSRYATCYDEPNGEYRCICLQGYIDKSPDSRYGGRICEPPPPVTLPPPNPCQNPDLNDCHINAACRSIGAQSYTCECLPGFEDHSPDKKNKPGRVCVQKTPVCLDSNLNDCHPAAICREANNADGYTCLCRDGYVDQSPDKTNKPGRICVEQKNECLDKSLNDCDPIAVCEDLPDGYTCRCPVNAIDQSPDKRRPGRKCFLKVNECANPSLNNCSRFADCIDRDQGYECKCREGYFDQNTSQPGTHCTFIVDECKSPTLNDCSRHAKCTDTPAGYECECIPPYKDEGPKDRPGRVCTYNECNDDKANNCDKKNARCVDLEDGYICQCLEGFYDQSPDPVEHPGEVCIGFSEEETTKRPEAPEQHLIRCGNTGCDPAKNETCCSSRYCCCKPGQGRSSPEDVCQPIDKIPLTYRVVSDNNKPLSFSSQYFNNENPEYVEFEHKFNTDLGESVKNTKYGPQYVNTEIELINSPKTVNSSWPEGLLVNFTVGVKKGSNINVCDLWDELMKELQNNNFVIGNGHLLTASDIDLLDPCPPPVELCGGQVCNATLGMICIAGRICGCPQGQKQASPNDKCRDVEEVPATIWIVRKNHEVLHYNRTFGNPLDELNKKYVEDFKQGVADSYPQTSLKGGFVTSDVKEIVEPKSQNPTWDHGIIYNATFYFEPGTYGTPEQATDVLVDYVKKKNNYELGHSGLFLNENECAGANECSEFAVCFDLPNGYRCECKQGYKDVSPVGHRKGSVCEVDQCAGLNCPTNSTCTIVDGVPKCVCGAGLVDISACKNKAALGIAASTLCLALEDVDECACGLANCAASAKCIDTKKGFTCACPEGWTDGNPNEPGTLCAAPRAAEICSGHGVLISDASGKIYCKCEDGYSGEHCESHSIWPLILLLILALLFLLLMLCLLLYLCTKCHCFKARREGFGHLDESFSSAETPSDMYKAVAIPRARIDDSALAARLERRPSVSSGDSDYTIAEEIERRVITDVNVTETRMVTNEQGVEEAQTVHSSYRTYGGAEALSAQEAAAYDAASSSAYASGSAARAGRSAGYGQRNSAYSGYDYEEEEYETDEEAVVDKIHNSHHSYEVDPSQGLERFKNENTTTKYTTETYHR